MNAVSGLYGITVDADPLTETKVLSALKGGCQIIQYRNKTLLDAASLRLAEKLKRHCDQFDAFFIINDDITLAKEVDADGVHIGRDDDSPEKVKADLPNKIVGVSCYNQLELALKAEQQGADYVAFGRFFPSITKPAAAQADIDLLLEAKQRLTIPIVAIGGITMNNADSLIKAGADAIAVIHGLFQQTDVEVTARSFSEMFKG